jgi:Gram-negative bacterial TonB protein C-terminal
MNNNLFSSLSKHLGWCVFATMLFTSGLQAQTMAQNTSNEQQEFVTELEEVPIMKNWPEMLALLQYPDDCYELGMEGKVPFQVLISEEGLVLETKVADGVHPSFVKAIKDAVVVLRSSPGIYKGEPIKTWVGLQVQFDLKTEKALRKKRKD